jgi:putative transposase
MVHPYTPFCPTFDYQGRYTYFLTFVTDARVELFAEAATVDLVLKQFLRASQEKDFELIAYCFMPDHAHIIASGLADESDLKAFTKLAKQYSGYYYARTHDRQRLWQHGSNDHIVREDVDLLRRLRYLVNNPVAAGLVERAEDYPFLGSQRWSRAELVERCKQANLK